MSDPSLMTLVKKLPTATYWKRRKGKHPSHIKKKLKKDQLKDHLNGLYAIGLGLIPPGHDKTHVALFDIDNHSDDDVPVRNTARELAAAAAEVGLEGTVFTSSGGKGAHIIFIWDEPQDAYSVRQALNGVLEDCLLMSGTEGLEKNQVEVFPKQDSVPKDGYGNMFILPYAFESEWLAGSWQASRSVPGLRSEDKHDTTDVEVDPDLLRSAVGALPNLNVSYDEWRNTVFAIHAASGGSAAGLALAIDWSSKSNKHDVSFLRERVWPYVKAGRGITARTLLAKAREAGWNDDVMAGFDDLGKDTPDAGTETPTPGANVQADGLTADVPILPAFIRDNNGRIEASVGNLENALRAAMVGGNLGFDDFTGQMMLLVNGEWCPMREGTNVAMRIELEKRGFKSIGKEAFRDVMVMVAESNTFDSAQDWLSDLEWDGVPRVDTFLSTYFKSAPTEYHASVSRYLWTAMAGRVCTPGLQVDMVPVLIGGQGCGKSTALVRMVPRREQLIEIDLTGRESDLSRNMQGALIGEIAELRGLHSRDDEHIKAMITRTQEKWVPKYREVSRVFNRRLVMVGTTNDGEFLSDHTGNRRWLPVDVGNVDRDGIERDREQLWAEAHLGYEQHGLKYAKVAKLAQTAQLEHQIEDPWETLITRYITQCEDDFEPKEVGDSLFLQSNEVLILSGAMPDVSRTSRAHQMRLSRVMKSVGYTKGRRWDKTIGKSVRGWELDGDELV